MSTSPSPRSIPTLASLVWFLACPVLAQGPNRATPDQLRNGQSTQLFQTEINDIHRKLDRVEEQHRHTGELVKSAQDSNRVFLTIMGTIIGLIVGVQSLFQVSILRHQWSRDIDKDNRDREKDAVSNSGARAVSEVLGVVRGTLDARLTQEKKAQDEAEEARKQVQNIRDELGRVVVHFERLAQTAHDRLETLAERLASFRRHDFKEHPDRLADFAEAFEEYDLNLKPLAHEGLGFSARVLYVRGIAAHYASQPELVKKFLTDVTKQTAPERGETDIAHSRRLGNAYFYLAVNESNFANYADALHLLEQAVEGLDSNDLLSRLVTAECYLFGDQLQKGLQYLAVEVDARISEMKLSGSFRGYHMPFQVRSSMLQANVSILRADGDWPQKVVAQLSSLCADEPDNYYALATLAQAYLATSDARAETTFDQAYDVILKRRHLETTTEIRSRVLLVMTAGMCSKMGSKQGAKKRMPEEFLEEARRLLERLPRRGADECTVFSIISKRNENRNVIAGHIGQIEAGIVVPTMKRAASA